MGQFARKVSDLTQNRASFYQRQEGSSVQADSSGRKEGSRFGRHREKQGTVDTDVSHMGTSGSDLSYELTLLHWEIWSTPHVESKSVTSAWGMHHHPPKVTLMGTQPWPYSGFFFFPAHFTKPASSTFKLHSFDLLLSAPRSDI
jgi:hypothetical protein